MQFSAPDARRASRHFNQKVGRPPPGKGRGRRKRWATSNRVLTMLKAALNRAYYAGRVPSDDAWRKVKPFREPDEPLVGLIDIRTGGHGSGQA
jgi:hypothetical protein